MEGKKQTGFTLFPQPPTPPTKRSRARTKSSSNGSNKITKSQLGSGRKQDTEQASKTTEQKTSTVLVPAPLVIRKTVDDIPPVPAVLTCPITPPRPKRHLDSKSRTPDHSPFELTIVSEDLPLQPLPQTPSRLVIPKSRMLSDFAEKESGYKKGESSRLSQWLDLEDGEIDRKRLSRYLGSVLDQTFEVPTLETMPRASRALLRRLSRLELESVVEKCACPPDTIICHCSSSPEFEHFRSWAHHKPNSSVSSTACLVGVPRARFQPAFFAIPEPASELSSPPGLAFDAEEDDEDANEATDWVGPKTPSRDDVFRSPSSGQKGRLPGYPLDGSPSTWSWTPSRFQSFSRPFASGSSSQRSDSSVPSTPCRSQSRSTAPKSGFLTSISTLSSFDFDFDVKARCQSLAQEQGFDFNFGQPSMGDCDSSGHLRTDSNESLTSQYELSTATATVAMSSASLKPVLVTNIVKRNLTPVLDMQSDDVFSSPTSPKSSTSSFSVPSYWRQVNASSQVHSRSTTVASNETDASAAMSAMLTMPILVPRDSKSPTLPKPGNAFAQRSNTLATMPLPHSSKTAHDAKAAEAPTPLSDPSLARSNTTPAPVPQPSPSKFDNAHVQAHANASARLKAFMDACADTSPTSPSTPTSSSGRFGLGLSTGGNGDRKKKKKYSGITQENAGDRGDSGIFGRLSVLGAVPGRREFSEPQYYRGLTISR